MRCEKPDHTLANEFICVAYKEPYVNNKMTLAIRHWNKYIVVDKDKSKAELNY